jgi:hypothetical protein
MRCATSNWTAVAACSRLRVDDDLFFDPARTDEALAVCAECPVRRECLADEVAVMVANGELPGDVHGVRGGMTATQRRDQLALSGLLTGVPAVTGDGLTIAQAAADLGVSKRTLQRRRAAQRAAAQLAA